MASFQMIVRKDSKCFTVKVQINVLYHFQFKGKRIEEVSVQEEA